MIKLFQDVLNTSVSYPVLMVEENSLTASLSEQEKK